MAAAPTLVADGLDNPRGMALLPGGDLVVAEAGSGDHDGSGRFSGRIVRLRDVDGDGRWLGPEERTVLLGEQLSYNGRSVFATGRDEVGGLGDVEIGRAGALVFTRDDPFGGYLADGASRDIAVAELAADGGRPVDVLSGRTTLNAVVWDASRGEYFALESGANRLVAAAPGGTRRIVASFPPLADGQQAVPAGLALDPRDGSLWVALFSGVLYDVPRPGARRSFEPGASQVVRVDPETGTTEVVLRNLTTAVDVAVGAAGTLYVLEMTTGAATARLPEDLDLHDPDLPPLAGGYERFRGRLTAHAPDGSVRILAAGLDTPSHLLLTGDAIYVATGQGTPGRPIPGPTGPTGIRGQIWRVPVVR